VGKSQIGEKLMKKIISSIYLKIKTIPLDDLIIVIGGIFLALLFRYFTKSFISADYRQNSIWYETVKAQGFSAFGSLREQSRGGFNYPPFFLYLLYGASVIFPKLSTVSALKVVSVSFDLLEALFVYKIIRLKFRQGPVPFLAGFAFLFAPTILLNSSVWGQTDSITTAFLLASLYFILKKQGWWACLAFGFAFAMKLEAIFFAPFLIVLLLKREISWKQIMLIPAVYFVLCIPAWIAGRPIWDLLTIYWYETTQFPSFELNLPNIYFKLPNSQFSTLSRATLVIAAGMIFIYIASIYKSHVKMTRPVLLLLALVSVVFMPYFLPRMHDRYFYAADAFSIVFGFYFPEYFLIPVLINLFSFFVYEIFLFHLANVPGYLLQLAITFVLVYLGKITITTLYSSQPSLNNSENTHKPDNLPVDLPEDSPSSLDG
jgi:Gpi18-like mannosyltransferase